MAVTVTVDVSRPQVTGGALACAASTGGSVIVMETVAVHPFASVTVNVCVPAPRVNGPVPAYGGVPPEAVTVTVDVPPWQEIAVAVAEASSGVGCVSVIVTVSVHPFASVTTNTCVPAWRLNLPVPR
jgi:hypothetical protein